MPPLQQIFHQSNSSSRSTRKSRSSTASSTTNPVDKVYTQDEKEAAGDHGTGLLPRSASLASTCSNSNAEICRICHSEADHEALLISPCHCIGSLRFVHQKCLQRWIKSSQAKTCELCKYEFQMQSKTKPLNKWEKLDMSPVERRKILCSVMFHVIAITCVVWSLYVLIDRTTEEIASGNLEWPFWTKLIVVAIGFTGGVVFMYVQCKMYIQLCRRWKTYNRVIFIQTCQPEARSPTNTPPPPPLAAVVPLLLSNSHSTEPHSPPAAPPSSLTIHADQPVKTAYPSPTEGQVTIVLEQFSSSYSSSRRQPSHNTGMET